MRDATRQEIAELTRQMEHFEVSLSDVADNCPRQQRTLAACRNGPGIRDRTSGTAG